MLRTVVNDKTRRAVRMVALASCLAVVLPRALFAAIPSEEECKKARAALVELTGPEFDARQKGKKTHEQVGDAFCGYAENENSSAGKFVLLQDAFKEYVLGKSEGSVTKASKVYGMAFMVGGMEWAQGVALPSRPKLSSIATSKNPSAKELKKRVDDHGKIFKLLDRHKLSLQEAQKKAPGDAKLCEELGVVYAACGDWKSAHAAFVMAAGEVAKVAGWELNGCKSADFTSATAGDFWWKYANNLPKLNDLKAAAKDVEDAMKIHAAMWYGLALSEGRFVGNEEVIVKKHVDEVKRILGVLPPPPIPPKSIMLEFSADNVIELIGCPAGEFMMGQKGDDKKDSLERYHKVKITRPFWMGKYKVTHKVWNVFEKIDLSEQDAVFGGWNRVHMTHTNRIEEFFDWLNKFSKFKRQLPKGYVFRLPTEAEWEYALNAACEDENDPYIMYKRGDGRMLGKIAVDYSDATPRDTNRVGSQHMNGMEVGTKMPNAWGFYDMLSNGGDMTLDSFNVNDGKVIKYADEETDPLRFSSGGTKRWLTRTHEDGWPNCWCIWWFGKRFEGSGSQDIAFHIVIGPDLMKEKGYDKKDRKSR